MSPPPRAPDSLPGIAVVGCGAWGRNHVRTLAALGALRAVADADADTAAAAAEAGGVPARTFADILADPAIDGVVLATPDAGHGALARQVLETGRHVLVEKPMTTSVPDAERLVELAAARQRVLMTGHILRYHTAFLHLQALVEGGAVGPLRHIACRRHHLSGGAPRHALWDLAPHDLSMVLALAGRMPVSVRAAGAAPIAGAPPQVVSVELDFGAGLSADISLSAIHPVKLHQATVAGPDGFAVFEDTKPWPEKVTLVRPGLGGRGARQQAPQPLAPDEPLRAEAQAFLAAIGGGPAPASNGEEGIRVVRVLAACQRALDDGGAVAVDA